jgi:hypothetical protein
MKTGIYDDWKRQDADNLINNNFTLNFERLMTGGQMDYHLDNPFSRFHQNIQDYPHFHDDIDDLRMIDYTNWERLRPYTAKEGTTVGDTKIIPDEDNDQKLVFYDYQGESIYTNPPDPNMPFIDHGLDEDHVWAFQLNGYN